MCSLVVINCNSASSPVLCSSTVMQRASAACLAVLSLTKADSKLAISRWWTSWSTNCHQHINHSKPCSTRIGSCVNQRSSCCNIEEQLVKRRLHHVQHNHGPSFSMRKITQSRTPEHHCYSTLLLELKTTLLTLSVQVSATCRL